MNQSNIEIISRREDNLPDKLSWEFLQLQKSFILDDLWDQLKKKQQISNKQQQISNKPLPALASTQPHPDGDRKSQNQEDKDEGNFDDEEGPKIDPSLF